jgi:hypothetical protein
MKTFIIVKKETLEIMGSYEAEQKDDTSANRSWLQAEPMAAHLELTEGLDKDTCEAYMDGEQMKLRLSEAKVDAQLEMAWTVLRDKRDAKLTETDKFMLPDFPISEGNKALIEAYREALRDLPSQVSDPRDEVEWPTKPNV